MGLFSKKSDDTLAEQGQAFNAARQAQQSGQPVVAAAYTAQSDDAMDRWLAQTEQEHDERKRNG